MSIAGKPRVNSQIEKFVDRREMEIPQTIPATVLYSMNDSMEPRSQDSPLKQSSETPLRRQSATAQTPFHEPHINFTPSQNGSLAGPPILAPLTAPVLDYAVEGTTNLNEKLLDEDPNETQMLTPKSKSQGKSAGAEFLSPLDNVSSPEEKSPKKLKQNPKGEEGSDDGEKVRLLPLSNENWRDNLASDSSAELTSPTMTKTAKDISKSSSKWKEREPSDEVVSPKSKDSPVHSLSEGFDLAIPTPTSTLRLVLNSFSFC
jgi:hypothetical protein